MDPYTDDEQPRGGGFDPMQLLRIFLRRKWLFIIPFFLCLGMAAVAIKIQKPIFYSSGQVRVIQEASGARSLPQEMPRYGRNPDAETFALIETMITSPRFLVGVVKQLDLHRRAIAAGEVGPAPDWVRSQSDWEERVAERLAGRLEGQIRIRNDGMRLFTIGVRDEDPDRAYRLVRVILERFLEEERVGRLRPTSTARDFLEAQRDSVQQQLVAAQRRLTEVQRSIVAESLVGNPISEQNLAQAEASLARLRSQAFDTDAAELQRLGRNLRGVVPAAPTVESYLSNPDLAAGVRELAGLEFDIALGLLGVRGPSDPSNPLGAARLNFHSLTAAHTARLYPNLAEGPRALVIEYAYNLLYREVTQRLVGRLERNINDFRSFRARQPEQAVMLDRLQQEARLAQDQLQAIERDISSETLRLQASLSEIGYKIEIRRDPRRPGAPIEPNKMRMAFMGAVLAFALGCGLVILAEFMDRSFKSVPAIERALGLKVIGTLPMIQTTLFSETRQRRPLLWVAVVLVILIIAAVGFLFVYPRLS